VATVTTFQMTRYQATGEMLKTLRCDHCFWTW